MLQRVSRASVTVDGEVVGAIGAGLVALVAATHDDGPKDVETVARKIAELRILPEETSVAETGAAVLVVSQFTLYGDTKKGRRPSWVRAAPGEVAEPLVDAVADALRGRGIEVATGRFGAMMQVELVNDGPFTVLVDT
ncbi:D-aminoacyl-tRNA deacylase [Ornithinimicrobium pekingense]|uniref:D-aminoacyl-tRNA deacylase n=1 Tax=Ornithinimicrobium pekingense TaxID=384677 RepID=A0ABQ2FBV4_9MICO|nr:D-aminoacyl-tRNA deacylase [Ornithinimicrobium pekingense]